MNNSRQLALAALALAALSGCATTGTDLAANEAAAPAAVAVSRPAPSYGTMGGYRYRRLVRVTIVSAS